MSFRGVSRIWAAAFVGALLFLSTSLPAQNDSPSSKSEKAPLPPSPPAVKSPVEFFRELLAMNGAERKEALANRSPESQKVIMAKLREYAALTPNDRELRLQATELRWYLWPLMNSPVTNRPAQLTNIPPSMRVLVETRLTEWDGLSPDVRKELLENEATLKYFLEVRGRTAEQIKAMMDGMKPAERERLQEGIRRWNALTDNQRQNLGKRFDQFFQLTDQEQNRALKTLSAQERRQIEMTLRAFGRLPAAERQECIRSFEKFADLNLIQRQIFLKNAERWKQMTPDERQAWRELVSKVPSARLPIPTPPLPPDMPPLPTVTGANKASKPVATNGN